MEPQQLIQLQRDTRSSIEVTRYKDGTPGWTIKAYYADGEEADAIARIQATEVMLRRLFLAGGIEQLEDEAIAITGDPTLLAQLEASIAAREQQP